MKLNEDRSSSLFASVLLPLLVYCLWLAPYCGLANGEKRFDIIKTAVALEEHGKWQRAIQIFERELKVNANNAPEWEHISNCYLQVRDYKNLDRCLLSMRKKFKSDNQVQKFVCEMMMICYTETGELEKLQLARREYLKFLPREDDKKKLRKEIAFFDYDFSRMLAERAGQLCSSSEFACRCINSTLNNKAVNVWFVPNYVPSKIYSREDILKYEPYALDALHEWSEALRDFCIFSVNQKMKPDIVCEWRIASQKDQNLFFEGSTTENTSSHIPQITIFLTPAKELSKQEFYKICLHEFGHALGLIHSLRPDDAMYWCGRPHLSNTDIERVRRLFQNVVQSEATAKQFVKFLYWSHDYDSAFKLLSDSGKKGFRTKITKASSHPEQETEDEANHLDLVDCSVVGNNTLSFLLREVSNTGEVLNYRVNTRTQTMGAPVEVDTFSTCNH